MYFCLYANFEALLSSSFTKIYGKLSTVAKLSNSLGFSIKTMYKNDNYF